MIKCEICGKGTQSWEDRRDAVLLGGYRIRICASCENEWAEHAQGSEVVREHNLASAQFKEDPCMATAMAHSEADRAMFAFAKAWVEDAKKNHAATADDISTFGYFRVGDGLFFGRNDDDEVVIVKTDGPCTSDGGIVEHHHLIGAHEWIAIMATVAKDADSPEAHAAALVLHLGNGST